MLCFEEQNLSGKVRILEFATGVKQHVKHKNIECRHRNRINFLNIFIFITYFPFMVKLYFS